MTKQVKFKVGDKVKVRIPEDQLDSFNQYEPNFSGDWHGVNYFPDPMATYLGCVGEVTEYDSYLKSYRILFKNSDDWYFPESFIVSVKDTSETLNGHLWLIVNKKTGKVIEGYQTRKEARDNLAIMYDNSSQFKILKYTFDKE